MKSTSTSSSSSSSSPSDSCSTHYNDVARENTIIALITREVILFAPFPLQLLHYHPVPGLLLWTFLRVGNTILVVPKTLFLTILWHVNTNIVPSSGLS